jgi:hypothetical protein
MLLCPDIVASVCKLDAVVHFLMDSLVPRVDLDQQHLPDWRNLTLRQEGHATNDQISRALLTRYDILLCTSGLAGDSEITFSAAAS